MMETIKGSFDIGILVSNIEACLDFYENALGLEMIGEAFLPFGKMYRLRIGSSDIKLIHPYKKCHKGTIGLESQRGFRYITFTIKNLSALCAELQNRGIEFVQLEKEYRPGVRIAMVKDPDDNLLEFVELS